MFNTTRSDDMPDILNDEKYNTHEVVVALKNIFLGKCYLCEQDDLSDPEIEHFDPHEGDKSKKYDWKNLYYACSRCNSIKSNTHKNLLDCCDINVDVFRSIKCLMPQAPDETVTVVAMTEAGCIHTSNTVELLNRCYNENNTALRGITRTVLVEKLFDHYSSYLTYRCVLRDKRSTEPEKLHAKGRIQSMLKVEFPFSVFWRWHFLSDEVLNEEHKDLIEF